MNNKYFWLGVKESFPIMVGVVPFGITCGVMAVAVGLKPYEALLMSLLVFAGASQFVAISMLGAGVAGWGIITLATLLVNLRHLLMGAFLAPHLLRLPLAQQMMLSFGLVDETYALTVNQINKEGYSAEYQLGSSMALYTSWALSTLVGTLAGSYIDNPLKWGIDFAMPATFLALLIPQLKDRVSLLVFLVAAVIVIPSALYIPGKWYIIIAALSASLIGGLLDGGEKCEA